MVLAGVAFFSSLLGLFVLFTLKHWESSRSRTFLPELRKRADVQALRLKQMLTTGMRDIKKIPPRMLFLGQAAIRTGAITFGHLAHWLGERSHALADLISQKNRFERRETRSEFLRKVIEHPMRARNNIPPAVMQTPATPTAEMNLSGNSAAASDPEVSPVPEKPMEPAPKVKRRRFLNVGRVRRGNGNGAIPKNENI